MEISGYTLLYYMAVVISVMTLPFFFSERDWPFAPRLKAAMVVAIIVIYLAAMFRTEGVDTRTYVLMYNHLDTIGAADAGFGMLIRIFNFLGAPFAALMLLSGITSVVALWRSARYFQVSFALVLTFWFVHLAVVRDFSQFRIGFAVSIVLFGITSSSVLLRLAFYALGFTMHFTALALIMSYEYFRLVMRINSRAWRYFFVALAMGGIIVIGKMIAKLAFLDPRISVYLNWQTAGYGVPVDSYGTLILHGLVLAIAIMGWRGWKGRKELEILFWLEALGIMSFIAFFSVSVFATRISNVVLSLYPVLLIHSVNAIRTRLGDRPAIKLGAGVVALTLMLILTVRPGSFDIVNSIGF